MGTIYHVGADSLCYEDARAEPLAERELPRYRMPQDNRVFRVGYLGGDLPTFALSFSRPAGQVIAQYYLLLRHGHAGCREIHKACAGHARTCREVTRPIRGCHKGIFRQPEGNGT